MQAGSFYSSCIFYNAYTCDLGYIGILAEDTEGTWGPHKTVQQVFEKVQEVSVLVYVEMVV